MTTYTKILNEFKNSNIKIISLNRLKQYINFCLENNQFKRIKGKTSHHHILPNKLFPEYKDLKSNPWNGTHLLYSDHYYVHWLLTEAIDNYSMLFAFCAMHNMDLRIGRIDESNLIPLNQFQKKMEERSIRQRLFMKTTKGLEAIQRMKDTKNSKEWKETVGKEASRKKIITIQTVQDNGKTIAENVAIKGAITMSVKHENGLSIRDEAELKRQETLQTVQENGLTLQKLVNTKQSETKQSKKWKETVGKEAKRKEIETKSSKEWQENVWKPGMIKRKELIESKEWQETVGKEAIFKMRMTKLKGIRYNVMRRGEIIFKELTKPEMNNISPALIRTSEKTPLGNTRVSKLGLNRVGKLHLIGMYYVKININKK